MDITRRSARTLLFALTFAGCAPAPRNTPAAPPAPAAAPAPAGAAAQPAGLDTLIEKLNANDWRIRDAAQALIVDTGEPAVKPVEELAAKSSDPDVQRRARDILRQIEAASLLQPTLVTLQFKDAPARDVYKSLFEQAHAELITSPRRLFEDPALQFIPPIPPVTINVQNVPFWEAFVELQKQTGVTLEHSGGETVMTDRPRRRLGAFAGKEGISMNGPFMVVTGLFGDEMIQGLKVFVEPRIRVLSHAMEAEIEEVDNESGPRWPRRMRAGHGGMMDPRGGNVFEVRHYSPIRNTGHVRGTVGAVVVLDEQTVEMDGVAKANNVKKTVDGRTVVLNTTNQKEGEWAISVVVHNTDPPTKGILGTKVKVTDAKGTPFWSGHGYSGSEEYISINMKLRQEPGCGPPEKIRITIPTKTAEIDIPFQFKPSQVIGAIR